jgi:hypothetical protein
MGTQAVGRERSGPEKVGRHFGQPYRTVDSIKKMVVNMEQLPFFSPTPLVLPLKRDSSQGTLVGRLHR